MILLEYLFGVQEGVRVVYSVCVLIQSVKGVFQHVKLPAVSLCGCVTHQEKLKELALFVILLTSSTRDPAGTARKGWLQQANYGVAPFRLHVFFSWWKIFFRQQVKWSLLTSASQSDTCVPCNRNPALLHSWMTFQREDAFEEVHILRIRGC